MTDQNFINLCNAVYLVTGFNMDQIRKKNRSRSVLYPRQVIAYLLRSYYGYTFTAIGKLFKQHHTSVMHSITSIETMISINDPLISDLIQKINTELAKSGHFNGKILLSVYVPINSDLEGLKKLLIDRFSCSFNIF